MVHLGMEIFYLTALQAAQDCGICSTGLCDTFFVRTSIPGESQAPLSTYSIQILSFARLLPTLLQEIS